MSPTSDGRLIRTGEYLCASTVVDQPSNPILVRSFSGERRHDNRDRNKEHVYTTLTLPKKILHRKTLPYWFALLFDSTSVQASSLVTTKRFMAAAVTEKNLPISGCFHPPYRVTPVAPGNQDEVTYWLEIGPRQHSHPQQIYKIVEICPEWCAPIGNQNETHSDRIPIFHNKCIHSTARCTRDESASSLLRYCDGSASSFHLDTRKP